MGYWVCGYGVLGIWVHRVSGLDLGLAAFVSVHLRAGLRELIVAYFLPADARRFGGEEYEKDGNYYQLYAVFVRACASVEILLSFLPLCETISLSRAPDFRTKINYVINFQHVDVNIHLQTTHFASSVR